jgi:hypothetical protein
VSAIINTRVSVGSTTVIAQTMRLSLAAETQQKRTLVIRHLVGLSHDNDVAIIVAQCTQDITITTWVCATILRHLGVDLAALNDTTRLTAPLVAGLTVTVNMTVAPDAARAVAVRVTLSPCVRLRSSHDLQQGTSESRD